MSTRCNKLWVETTLQTLHHVKDEFSACTSVLVQPFLGLSVLWWIAIDFKRNVGESRAMLLDMFHKMTVSGVHSEDFCWRAGNSSVQERTL